MENTTTICRVCGCETAMLGTKLCDRCWELERRIHADPELARHILAERDRTIAEVTKIIHSDE